MEMQGCVKNDCKLFEHCRPDLNGVPPCANIKEPAQHSDNIDYTAAFEAELTSIANDSKMCIPSIILQTWATRLNSVVKTYSSLQAPR
jgi:hypothetical protein